MKRRPACVAGLWLLAMATTCGDSSKSIPLAELPPKLAQALCTAYQKCYGPVFDLFLSGGNCVTTTEQRIRNGSFPMLQGEIDQGKLVYDGSKAQACLDSLSSRTCAQMLERDSAACLAALDGTVGLGAACTLDEDCRGQAICKSAAGTCPGQCTPLLVAGQACGQDADCQSGLQCSSETGLCVVPASDGQACEYGSPPCGPGLLCLGKDDSKQTAGTCKTPAAALAAAPGGACDPGNALLCQSGSSCVLAGVDLAAGALTWTCVTTGSYAAGGACNPGFPDACAGGTYCKTAGSVLALLGGTCTAIPASGEACGTGLSACQPGAVCAGSTCQNLVANGVSCTANLMCFSGYCGTGGGCEPKLPCK
jgi:hypothetical protein